MKALARIAHNLSAADAQMAESFDEFLSRVLDRAVLCLRPRSGEFVKIFNHLRILATKCCERCGLDISILFLSALSCCFLSGCALSAIQKLPMTRAASVEITHAGFYQNQVRIDYTYDGGSGTSCFDGGNVPSKIVVNDESSLCPVGATAEPLLVVVGLEKPKGAEAPLERYLQQYHPGDSYIDYFVGRRGRQFALYRRRWWGYPAMVILAPPALVADTVVAIIVVPVGAVVYGGAALVVVAAFARDDNWWHL